MEQRRKRSVEPLGYVNFIYFWPIRIGNKHRSQISAAFLEIVAARKFGTFPYALWNLTFTNKLFLNDKVTVFFLGLHNCQEFFQPLECLYQAMQTQEEGFLLLL